MKRPPNPDPVMRRQPTTRRSYFPGVAVASTPISGFMASSVLEQSSNSLPQVLPEYQGQGHMQDAIMDEPTNWSRCLLGARLPPSPPPQDFRAFQPDPLMLFPPCWALRGQSEEIWPSLSPTRACSKSDERSWFLGWPSRFPNLWCHLVFVAFALPSSSRKWRPEQ